MITYYFDKLGKVPMYEQLYVHIKESILHHELQAGTKMPSRRALSQHLKVSVQTVESAYSQLLSEGYLYSRPKSGYYVSSISEFPKQFKKKQAKLSFALKEQTFRYDFKTNVIDSDAFPYLQWARLEKEIILDDIKNTINAHDALGYYPLREEIAKYLYEFRGIETDPEHILIGSGSESLLVVIRLLVGEGKSIGLENPGYPKLEKLYRAYGVSPYPISVDEQGFVISDCPEEVALIHVTPSHQFPSGKVMSISRRMELLEWVTKYPFRYIIEDDYDSEFRFVGNPIPALWGMDHSGQVIYINNFTKSIAPSLRISFMVLPDHLIQKYLTNYRFLGCPVSLLGQVSLQQFMKRGLFARHLNKMKIHYKNKRDHLIAILKASSFGNMIHVKGAEAGLHFLLEFHQGVSEKDLVERAKKQDVRLYGIQEYLLDSTIDILPTLVLGYSDVTIEAMNEALKRLEIAWKE